MMKRRFGCGADALVGIKLFRNLVKLTRPDLCLRAGDDISRILTYFVSSLGFCWGSELMLVVSDASAAFYTRRSVRVLAPMSYG